MRMLFRTLLVALVGLCSLSAFAGARATLVIDNLRPDAVYLSIDHGAAASVPGNTERAFRVNVGTHDAVVRAADGRVLSSARVNLGAGAVNTISLAPPKGVLEVNNGSGTTLNLIVDGSASKLSSGQRRQMDLKPGTHRVVATYTQLGRERVLVDRDISVAPDALERLALAPATTGLVRVENRTGRDALLRVDNRQEGWMRDGESREITTHLGRVDLSLEAGGRELSRSNLAVGLYEDIIWRATAPRTGDLVVQSPMPMPVRLVDSRGRSYDVAAYGRVTLSKLDAGTFGFSIERMDGIALNQARVEIRPMETTRYTIPAPQIGVVSVVNDERFSVRILVDGRDMGNVYPTGSEKLALGLGAHTIELLDNHGRVAQRSRVVVDRYQDAIVVLSGRAVSWDDDRDHHHGDDHHGDDRRDDHERPESRTR